VALVPVVTAVAWYVARRRMGAAVAGAVQRTSDVRLDVARLQHAPPLTVLTARIDSLERESVWVPLMGWALVAPLSMHLMFAISLGWVGVGRLEQFDWWILVSLVLTSVGHAVLCVMAVRFARRLRGWRATSGEKEPSVWAPYGWTLLGACVPGVILYAVPPAIAAVTALFIPVTFSAARQRVLSERAALAFLLGPQGLPIFGSQGLGDGASDHAAIAMAAQPTRNATPPSGVTAPSQRIPVSVIR
jgi:hypothetical protein